MSPDAVWIGWIALFVIYEVSAAILKRGGTLSEFVGRITGVRRWQSSPRRWSPARRALVFLFMQATTMHLVFGWTVVPVVVMGALFAVMVLLSATLEGRR